MADPLVGLGPAHARSFFLHFFFSHSITASPPIGASRCGRRHSSTGATLVFNAFSSITETLPYESFSFVTYRRLVYVTNTNNLSLLCMVPDVERSPVLPHVCRMTISCQHGSPRATGGGTGGTSFHHVLYRHQTTEPPTTFFAVFFLNGDWSCSLLHLKSN